MKKNLLYFMAGMALCATAASCSSDDDAVSAPKTLSATATIDNSNTRTSYGDQGAGKALKVDWKDSETFKAYYTEGGTTPLIFTKTDGSAFVATDVPEGVSASTTFTGVYGQKVTYYPETGKYTVDYRNQDGKLESLAKYDAMIATSTTDAYGLKFPFKHLSAFVKVTLKRGNHTHSSGTLVGLKKFSLTFDECQLNDESMEVVGWTSRKGSFSVDFTLDSELALNETRTVYIAIPPLKRYSEGYPQVLISPKGYIKLVDCDASSGMTFEAGKVYETEITYECGTNHGGWD